MLFTCEVDDDDAAAINEAIAKYQADNREPGGATDVPDGTSDLRGAVLGEIVRRWLAIDENEAFIARDMKERAIQAWTIFGDDPKFLEAIEAE